jgi:hypothetical protein
MSDGQVIAAVLLVVALYRIGAEIISRKLEIRRNVMWETLFELPPVDPDRQVPDHRLTANASRRRMWQTWRREHPEHASLPDRIVAMYALYGLADAARCKSCAHLVREDYHNTTYYKCGLSRTSRGAGTDWRVSWQACGRYSEEE